MVRGGRSLRVPRSVVRDVAATNLEEVCLQNAVSCALASSWLVLVCVYSLLVQ